MHSFFSKKIIRRSPLVPKLMHSGRMWTAHLLTASRGIRAGVCLEGVCLGGCVSQHATGQTPLLSSYGQNDWQTGIKTLSCPKLHLRAAKIQKHPNIQCRLDIDLNLSCCMIKFHNRWNGLSFESDTWLIVCDVAIVYYIKHEKILKYWKTRKVYIF